MRIIDVTVHLTPREAAPIGSMFDAEAVFVEKLETALGSVRERSLKEYLDVMDGDGVLVFPGGVTFPMVANGQ